MAKDYTIFVGCVGGGLSYSPDGGDTWERVRTPLPSECNVRALTVYPDDPHRILVGSDVGVFRSNDNGSNWEHIESPMDNVQVWSLAVDPQDSDTIFVGTRPDAVSYTHLTLPTICSV